MSQKVFLVPGVGEVLVVKRRAAKNLRLSINGQGKVRVSQPGWLPYASGAQYAAAKQDWIRLQLNNRPKNLLKDGDGIGKSFRLRFKEAAGSATKTRLIGHEVVITAGKPLTDPEVQAAARKACERALKQESETLLGIRLGELARRHGYSYKDFKVKKLTSRWGSCSSEGKITLSIYLIQLPWELIDYVILHELAHTRHLNHSTAFWEHLKFTVANALAHRRQIRQYQPAVMPVR